MTAGARDRARGVGGANTRAVPWLAWSLACLTLAMSAADLALLFLARSVRVPSGWDTASSSIVDDLLFFVALPVVGALIASRRPHNLIGWICLSDGLLWALINSIEDYSVYGLAAPGSVPYPVGIFALSAWMWVPAVGCSASTFSCSSPTGDCRTGSGARWPGSLGRRWCCSASSSSSPRAPAWPRWRAQPVRAGGAPWVAAAKWVLIPLLPACMLAAALSLVLRYRRSGGGVRQQIKWIAFAASLFGLAFLSHAVRSLVLPEVAPPLSRSTR